MSITDILGIAVILIVATVLLVAMLVASAVAWVLFEGSDMLRGKAGKWKGWWS